MGEARNRMYEKILSSNLLWALLGPFCTASSPLTISEMMIIKVADGGRDQPVEHGAKLR